MRSILLISIIMAMFQVQLKAQPYFDIANFKYMYSPDMGAFNHKANHEKVNYSNVNLNIPIPFKPLHGIAVINPFFEKWDYRLTTSNEPETHYQNIGLAVSFIDTASTHKIRLALSPIVRVENFSEDGTGSAQWGLAGLAIFHLKKITYKAGFYLNGEYFDKFFVPLLGIEWDISDKNKLFGILPGSLTFEHRIQNGFYVGGTFRSITNSYRSLGSSYFRIDDNQLGIYTDINFTKRFVFNAEAGHSFFRKIRFGQKDVYVNDQHVNDNFYFRCTLAYRIRFKQ